MASMFPRLFEPGKIGSLEIHNRVIKAPTYGCMCNPDGSVTDRLIRHYEEVACGGVGLVIVEAARLLKVSRTGLGNKINKYGLQKTIEIGEGE